MLATRDLFILWFFFQAEDCIRDKLVTGVQTRPLPISFFFQAEDGIRDKLVTGVQTCALPISEGVEYEERMRRLEDITYPRPLEEVLDAAYTMYRTGHPWVLDYTPEPKSVARDRKSVV